MHTYRYKFKVVKYLSLELINQIEQAEREAEEIRNNSLREARDVIKSVDEASIIYVRNSQLEIRDSVQRIIEEARIRTQDEIKELEIKRAMERESIRRAAQKKLDIASKLIFERIVY